MIFHIASRREWEAARARGTYRAASLDVEGFIHCSTAEQVTGVANAFYRGQRDLVVLEIDEAKLASEVRWEAPSPPTGDDAARFPHVYGPIETSAVVRAIVFPCAPDGSFAPLARG